MVNTTARSIKLHTFHACTALPRSRHIAGLGTFHLAGCSLSLSTSQLEVVLCIESVAGAVSKATQPHTASTHFMQPRLAHVPKITVKGCNCGRPSFWQHVVTLGCSCNKNTSMLRGHGMLVAKGHNASLSSDVFELRTKPFRVQGRRLACTGQALYGDMQEEVRQRYQAQEMWQAVGFLTTIVFSSDTGVCDAMRLIPGVQCELRNLIAPARRIAGRVPGRQQIYEQPILNAVCLAYARAAGSQYLALADTDDFAPLELPRLLNVMETQKGLSGVRLFFDSDMACPPRFCPSNASDWLTKCASAITGTARRKNHWKPIVVPSRTQEVAVHQFVSTPPFVQKDVWNICFSHRFFPKHHSRT